MLNTFRDLLKNPLIIPLNLPSEGREIGHVSTDNFCPFSSLHFQIIFANSDLSVVPKTSNKEIKELAN